tara:strand:- start:12038 stop:12622 length:585 start_codon:yes stop_codon:yes gene_type:complete
MRSPEFTIFVGPMFGSKTTKLLAAIDRYKYRNKNVIAFKPKIDDRYSDDQISTHSGGRFPAIPIGSGDDLFFWWAEQSTDYNVIAVDEAFMIPGISTALLTMFKSGLDIIVSSLDLSASLRTFEEVEKILPWATRIEKCPAVCTICNDDAFYTYRKIDGIAEITIGGADLYEPRCWLHHSLFSRDGMIKACEDD